MKAIVALLLLISCTNNPPILTVSQKPMQFFHDSWEQVTGHKQTCEILYTDDEKYYGYAIPMLGMIAFNRKKWDLMSTPERMYLHFHESVHCRDNTDHEETGLMRWDSAFN